MKIGVILRKMSFFFSSELGVDPSTNELNYSSMITTLNPFDEGALILALEQKDLNSKIEVFVAAMDSGEDSIDLLKNGINLGADGGILFTNNSKNSPSLHEDPYKWSKYLSLIEWDLFLVGANKIDTEEDEFGILLGEYLSVNVVSGIVNFELLPNGNIYCWRKLEKGNRELVECRLPALLTVEQINRVRYPSLKRIVSPKEKYIIKFENKFEKEQKNHKIILQKYRPSRTRTKGAYEFSELGSSSNLFQNLLSGGLDQKEKISGEEIKGLPEEIAQKFIEYLIKIDIL